MKQANKIINLLEVMFSDLKTGIPNFDDFIKDPRLCPEEGCEL
jgi:Fe-S-cluster formation regulator IscX/YfhJ